MESPIATPAAILLALWSGPAWGLQIAQRVHDWTQGRIRLAQGTVYPVLRHLEGESLVRSWVLRDGGMRGRPRRCYELTTAGMLRVARERELLEAFVRPVPGLPPSRSAYARMLNRLRRCAEVSEAAMAIRGQASSRRGPRP